MFKEAKVARLSVPGWEAVYRAELQPGVISLIAVHDGNRGTALGGCRMTAYASESQALTDALRLSRGMTYKNAAANLPLGGGKAVIACDPRISGRSRRALLREFGKFVTWVNRSKDLYCTAEDMNTTVEDMKLVKEHTRHVYGTRVDPSPYTAQGVFAATEYAIDFFSSDLFDGDSSLKGKRILIQGVGKVGMGLLEMFRKAGAQLLICDTRREALRGVKKICPGVTVIDPDEYLEQEVDVFVPCARGEVIKESDVPNLQFKILCGAANNQLQNAATGHLIHQRGIVYCPDFVANMGGVCSIYYVEMARIGKGRAIEKIQTTVRKMLGTTFRTAFKKKIPFNHAIDNVVEQLVWGGALDGMEFSNRRIFPLTYASQLSD